MAGLSSSQSTKQGDVSNGTTVTPTVTLGGINFGDFGPVETPTQKAPPETNLLIWILGGAVIILGGLYLILRGR